MVNPFGYVKIAIEHESLKVREFSHGKKPGSSWSSQKRKIYENLRSENWCSGVQLRAARPSLVGGVQDFDEFLICSNHFGI